MRDGGERGKGKSTSLPGHSSGPQTLNRGGHRVRSLTTPLVYPSAPWKADLPQMSRWDVWGPHGSRMSLTEASEKDQAGQRSPTFLALGTSFVEDNFSMDRVWGWFRR